MPHSAGNEHARGRGRRTAEEDVQCLVHLVAELEQRLGIAPESSSATP